METEQYDSAFEADLLEVVEAILFVSDDPVPPATISTVYAEVTGGKEPTDAEVESAMGLLNKAYAESGRIFRIHRWGGGFQIATEPRVDPFLRALVDSERVRKLSRTLLETLAVVAYRQPISKPEVDSVRGVDAGYALRKLLELSFVEIVGRSDTVGRPLIYGTTEQFLVQFGLDSLEDLPKLKELDELLKDPDLQIPRDSDLDISRGSENATPASTEANRYEDEATKKQQSPSEANQQNGAETD